MFHRIDCDEYWCYNLGSTIEVWIINLDGKLEIRHLGVTENADPLIHFPKGVIFGSRNLDTDGDGTFFTCVTVPRFDYKGFELIDKDEVIHICPEAAKFWNHIP